jgi:hypothetical protein
LQVVARWTAAAIEDQSARSAAISKNLGEMSSIIYAAKRYATGISFVTIVLNSS